MLKILSIAIVILSVLAPLPACAAPTQVFDGRSDAPTRKISDAESKSVQAAVSPAAKKRWKDYEDAFEIKSSCEGSFTQKGTKQIAYVYSWCETGHSIGMSGLAITEKGKQVAHFGWEGGGEYDIVPLPDLDGDGLDEIAIVGGSTNQGYTVSSIAVIGISAGAVKKYGRFQTYEDNSGTVEKNPTTFAWSITSDVPAAAPAFVGQKFKQVGKTWTKSGKSAKYPPEKDEIVYEKL